MRCAAPVLCVLALAAACTKPEESPAAPPSVSTEPPVATTPMSGTYVQVDANSPEASPNRLIFHEDGTFEMVGPMPANGTYVLTESDIKFTVGPSFSTHPLFGSDGMDGRLGPDVIVMGEGVLPASMVVRFKKE